MKKYFLCIVVLITINKYSYSNNVNITNVSTPSSTTIQFNISWDNSWFTAAPSNNWDAVWIFVKTQACATGSSPWVHANLSTSSANHSVTGGVLQVDAVSDGRGVFLRRSALGSGNIATATVTLTFSSSYIVANTNYEVLGIEMVQVPQGSFQVGDISLNSSTHSVNSFGTSNTTTPNTISSEVAIAAGGTLRNQSSEQSFQYTNHQALSASYPKGFNAFYCMKYEISQQQYVAFLNLLTFEQQSYRTAVVPSSAIGTAALATASGDNRNSIEIATPGVAFSTPAIYGNDLNGNNTYNEGDDGGNIACNYLSWRDLKAYLDWAALRPMTELEFEKAARGVNISVLREYAWGTTNITQAISSALTNGGQATELSTSTGNGLCVYNGASSAVLGPLRVGFAATGTTIREGAGASFYGIMDLSGNLWEQAITVGWNAGPPSTTAAGVNAVIFVGGNGDGNIDNLGDANTAGWGISDAQSIVRGGNWEYTAQRCQVSDRFYLGNTAENATRTRRTGGRGAR
jgi:formylglycine-generating enzyme required for sulfatase activity